VALRCEWLSVMAVGQPAETTICIYIIVQGSVITTMVRDRASV